MADSKRLTLQIRGTDQDGGDLRLGEFLKELDAWRKALRETARVLALEGMDLKIVDLSHDSPATVTLEVVSSSGDHDAEVRLIDSANELIDAVTAGREAPKVFDARAINAYKDLGAPLAKGTITQVGIKNGKLKEIPPNFTQEIDQTLGPDQFEDGSVTGQVEKINVHANTNVFTIYPTEGHYKLNCLFPSKLRTAAVNAVDHYATVYGSMKFKQRDVFPYEMIVSEIEIHPTETELPTLQSLRGIAPNLTGGLKSEEFIRRIRDGW